MKIIIMFLDQNWEMCSTWIETNFCWWLKNMCSTWLAVEIEV